MQPFQLSKAKFKLSIFLNKIITKRNKKSQKKKKSTISNSMYRVVHHQSHKTLPTSDPRVSQQWYTHLTPTSSNQSHHAFGPHNQINLQNQTHQILSFALNPSRPNQNSKPHRIYQNPRVSTLHPKINDNKREERV